MEHLETLSVRYLAVCRASERISAKGYPEFSRLCEEYHEISKNINIRKLREEAFQEIVQIYLERPGHPQELGEALLREGGYLLQKINTTVLPDLTAKLLKITKRLMGVPLKSDPPNLQAPVRDVDEAKSMTFQ